MTTENQVFGAGATADETFVDRRVAGQQRSNQGLERRQFSDSHSSLTADAAELGRAIDQYKLLNRRRYITYEEMLSVVKSLGYSKTGDANTGS